jgi:hypothetical protein
MKMNEIEICKISMYRAASRASGNDYNKLILEVRVVVPEHIAAPILKDANDRRAHNVEVPVKAVQDTLACLCGELLSQECGASPPAAPPTAAKQKGRKGWAPKERKRAMFCLIALLSYSRN